MSFKKVVLIALLATGSFTFANETKVTNKEKTIEVTDTIINVVENTSSSEDTCTITITVYRTTRTSTSTTVEIFDATGTGETCEEAEADARATLAS
ncbi:hypothetical protein GOQ30_12815 [Flavobacterium sp. TP390]|uniref:Uncharacterized protein n=1 Tax=Flavobacterium profundi TaxID=1774945 RepID=A0A6I4IT72_9FLAO|nr:hypothetical protein [Flavobacterium profundi]MVO10046.1 hypothetical protein [Flavobacterium profundi]